MAEQCTRRDRRGTGLFRFAFVGLAWLVVVLTASPASADQAGGRVELRSLDPALILSVLNLEGPGLEAARERAAQNDRPGTLAALLAYYRARFPLPERSAAGEAPSVKAADDIVRHVFHWGPYEPAAYGPEMDWAWDPRGDIEWVAAVYRFYWARELADAYRATRDEKYVSAFVELARDWIRKHPLEQHTQTHPVYTDWRGFAWLDIQTGNRATSLCTAFPILVHGAAFTPEFLGVFLASIYDHQVKTEKLPMNRIHNKAIFEQRGFVAVAYTFPEFRDAPRWLALALDRSRENLLAQTTADGVQREWSGGYHFGVLRDAVEIGRRAAERGVAVPEDYWGRVRKMYEYILGMAAPDLTFPMFNDASRDIDLPAERKGWPLYSTLKEAADLLGDPKYAAVADLDREWLPLQTSYAFAEGGMYALRSGWDPDSVYLALHCSPPAISGHDQPDNGTFELWAYGRWLMPDTGYFTYGHDAAARDWHRQTSVHQTLTLDGKNAEVKGRHRLWRSEGRLATLVVENESYPNLLHRRTVWFVDRAFFVLLDEAIGGATGAVDLHFQLAPGPATFDTAGHWVATAFDGANVLVWQDPSAPVTLEKEDGWFAWAYGKRTARRAFRFRHERRAPAAFVTVILPYRGKARPEVMLSGTNSLRPGADAVAVRVTVSGRSWKLSRDLKAGLVPCGKK
jgi:heparan-sulfate lyase